MAFQNITDLQLGQFIQTYFSKGIRLQISQDYRDWESVNMAKTKEHAPREIKFLHQTTLGAAAVQYRNPGTQSAFPSGQQVRSAEYVAYTKECDTTIEIEYNLYERAKQGPAYAEPLMVEIKSKQTAAKRRMAADYYGDGTGRVGTVEAGSTPTLPIVSGANNGVQIAVSAAEAFDGHIGFFEFGDKLRHYTAAGAAGTAPTLAAGTFDHWQVETKNRKNRLVLLSARDANGTLLDVTAAGIAAGSILYRLQPTIPNVGSIADYGTASEVMAGLESLVAGDGRTIHGILMSGANAGTRLDASGDPLDVSHIEEVMDNVKIAVGGGTYTWKKLCMAPESRRKFIESRETDRRFNTREDATRGVRVFTYQHEDDSMDVVTSEYVPLTRVYVKPEEKSGEKVFEYHGSDWKPVTVNNGQSFYLSSSGNSHLNLMKQYLTSRGVLICRHAASVGVITNFS